MKKILILTAALMLCACRAQPQPPEPAPQVVSSDTSAETTVSTADTTAETTEALSEAAVPEETAEAPAADKVASGDETIAPETVIADGTEPIYPDKIAKGTYEHVEVRSSSSMFKIADCTLEVGDTMTARLYFNGSAYSMLYPGTADEAMDTQAIERTETDDGYYFDIPVEALDKSIPVAAYSVKKEKWYGREIAFISTSLPKDAIERELVTADTLGLADGSYTAEVTLTGGSGKASIASPAELTVKDGNITAHIVWSSKNYDYMIVDEEKFLPAEGEEYSAFDIPVESFDAALPVRADTTAMSQPYEIEYTLYFDSSTVKAS